MDIPNYDNWKLASGLEDEKVACHCDHCDGEIYEGEDYHKTIDGDNVHEDCFLEYAKNILL